MELWDCNDGQDQDNGDASGIRERWTTNKQMTMMVEVMMMMTMTMTVLMIMVIWWCWMLFEGKFHSVAVILCVHKIFPQLLHCNYDTLLLSQV